MMILKIIIKNCFPRDLVFYYWLAIENNVFGKIQVALTRVLVFFSFWFYVFMHIGQRFVTGGTGSGTPGNFMYIFLSPGLLKVEIITNSKNTLLKTF